MRPRSACLHSVRRDSFPARTRPLPIGRTDRPQARHGATAPVVREHRGHGELPGRPAARRRPLLCGSNSAVEARRSVVALRFGDDVRRFRSTAPSGGWSMFPEFVGGCPETEDPAWLRPCGSPGDSGVNWPTYTASSRRTIRSRGAGQGGSVGDGSVGAGGLRPASRTRSSLPSSGSPPRWPPSRRT